MHNGELHDETSENCNFVHRDGPPCLGLSRSASADLSVYAATAQGDFGTLDLDTGAYTSIGPSGVTSIVGMGFIGGTLYGVDNNADGAGFYSINTATGAATFITT